MRKNLILYHPTLNIKDILQHMESQQVNYLAVVNEKGKLIGSISEADIRRALLTNKYLVKDFMNPYPIRAFVHSDLKKLKSQLEKNYSSHLPIVDENLKLVEVKTIKPHKASRKDNPVVLMVGGLGKRLGELTKNLPKPMLPLGHKPILQLILESFISYGFWDFYFCVNYKSETIKEYFGKGEEFGVKISYVEEEQALGTAGPLSLIEKEWDLPLIVMNGDLVTTLNFESLLNFHEEKGGMATMCIHEYNYQLPFGVVHTRNARILSLEEKPLQKCFINAGIYVLDKEALNFVDQNSYIDMTTVFERMLEADAAVHSYFINEFWLDIGQVKDYEATREVFSKQKP